MNATVYKRVPGVDHDRRGVDVLAGRHRPHARRRPRLRLQVEHGLDARLARLRAARPVHRSYHHGEMTFSLVYAWSENYVLPISHDEVVHGKGSLLRKMPGDRWQQLANLRAYLAFMWAHPGKQLLFMGGEIGQESEWAESRELDWWLLDHPEHRGRPRRWCATSTAPTPAPARCGRATTTPAGFQWIDANDAGRNVFSFVRRGTGDARPGLRRRTSPRSPTRATGSACRRPARGTRSLNTDAEAYAGSGVGNLGAVTAVEGDWSGQPAHADIVVPPLATVWLVRCRVASRRVAAWRRAQGLWQRMVDRTTTSSSVVAIRALTAAAGPGTAPGVLTRRQGWRRRLRETVAEGRRIGCSDWTSGQPPSTSYAARSRRRWRPRPGRGAGRPRGRARPAGRHLVGAAPRGRDARRHRRRARPSTASSTRGWPTTRRRTSRRASGRCSTPSSPASARSARCWCATPTAGCCCAS